jgi:Putative beta-barrel porin 2
MKKMQRGSAVLAALLLLNAAPALAQNFAAVDTLPWPSQGAFPAYPRDAGTPTDLWVQGGIRRDNNVLRTETNARSDTITRIGGGFRHDQRVFGRQRLVVDARGEYDAYDRFDSLNHFAYSVLGDWLWEIGNDLSGSVLLARERRQADISQTRSTVRDPVDLTRVGASGAYMVTPSMRLNAGAGIARAHRERARVAETDASSVSFGADYVSPLRNTLGVEYRRTWGDAPVPEFVAPIGTFVNNDFQERELHLVAAYALGAQLHTGGRLGRTERRYTELPGRDFSGLTYRAFIEWLPGSKTILRFDAYKAPQSVIDVAAGHLVVKGASFGPHWAASSKLVLSATFVRERRTFEGDPTRLFGEPLQDELVTLIRFGIGWEPQRHWQLSLALDRGERESNFVGRDYQFTAVMANVAWHY